MKKIAILGSADALKPKIIIETLVEMNLLNDIKIVLLTDEDYGICVDYCTSVGIEHIVFKDRNLNDEYSYKLAKQIDACLLISAGWPYKISSKFFGAFKYKAINCHGSVLPDYRGSRAYMHYWANCEEYYGATIHYMNEKFDDGNILVQGRLKFFLEETPIIMHRRSAELCAYLIPEAIRLVEIGYEGKKEKGVARYFKKITKEEFEKYREINVRKKEGERILTPHTII